MSNLQTGLKTGIDRSSIGLGKVRFRRKEKRNGFIKGWMSVRVGEEDEFRKGWISVRGRKREWV